MKRITVFAPGDIRYEEQSKPSPKPDQVLIKTKYCGVCGTDLAILNGEMKLIKDGIIRYPKRIGHEWSGIVEAFGEEVTDFKPGDRVISENTVSCGVCTNCRAGKSTLCLNGQSLGTVGDWDGAFTEYMIMPARDLFHLPDEIALDDASLIEPCKIAYCGLKRCDIDKNTVLLITGTGAIALIAVSIAKIMGTKQVFLTGRTDSKLEVGKQMGADAVINIKKENLREAVMSHTGGKGVSAVLEVSGAIEYISQSLSLLDMSGDRLITLIGFYEKELNHFNIDTLVMGGIQLRGIIGYSEAIPEIIVMMKSGKLNVKPLITHRFTFEKAIDEMLNAGEKKDKIKMLVEFN